MKSTLKCADLFTASFADGSLITGTLEQIYEAQNNRRMTIKPVVWLWCSDSGSYMVDYILEGAGWTLGAFETLKRQWRRLTRSPPQMWQKCSRKPL